MQFDYGKSYFWKNFLTTPDIRLSYGTILLHADNIIIHPTICKRMKSTSIPSFHFIGISVRTVNHGSQGLRDIENLWQQFLGSQISQQIPNKISEDIYAVYTDYEKDYTAPYTMILGHQVGDLSHIPDGMTGLTVPEAEYIHLTAKGNLQEGVVFKTWEHIWKSEYPRSYAVDFEVYGAGASNPENALVDIYLSIH